MHIYIWDKIIRTHQKLKGPITQTACLDENHFSRVTHIIAPESCSHTFLWSVQQRNIPLRYLILNMSKIISNKAMNANGNIIKGNEEKPQTCRLVALVVICETSSMVITTPRISARKKLYKLILGVDIECSHDVTVAMANSSFLFHYTNMASGHMSEHTLLPFQ